MRSASDEKRGVDTSFFDLSSTFSYIHIATWEIFILSFPPCRLASRPRRRRFLYNISQVVSAARCPPERESPGTVLEAGGIKNIDLVIRVSRVRVSLHSRGLSTFRPKSTEADALCLSAGRVDTVPLVPVYVTFTTPASNAQPRRRRTISAPPSTATGGRRIPTYMRKSIA